MEQLQHYPAAVSFTAGLLSFISPCILPLIPAYLSFITGYSLEQLQSGDFSAVRSLFNALLFVLGFTVIFVLLGASATWAGGLLGRYSYILRYAGGIIIIVFGLHITGIIRLRFLYGQRKLTARKRPRIIGPFLIGAIFAVGWTPCVGPILSSILLLASTEKTVIRGIILLSFYSLGLGIPFLVTSLLLGKALFFFNRVKRYYRIIEIVSGVILIVAGLLLITNRFDLPARLVGG